MALLFFQIVGKIHTGTQGQPFTGGVAAEEESLQRFMTEMQGSGITAGRAAYSLETICRLCS